MASQFKLLQTAANCVLKDWRSNYDTPLVVFGDSFADNGNFKFMVDNYPGNYVNPFGMPDAAYPTGRYSGDYSWADSLSDWLKNS